MSDNSKRASLSNPLNTIACLQVPKITISRSSSVASKRSSIFKGKGKEHDDSSTSGPKSPTLSRKLSFRFGRSSQVSAAPSGVAAQSPTPSDPPDLEGTAHWADVQNDEGKLVLWPGNGGNFKSYDGFQSDPYLYFSDSDCMIHLDEEDFPSFAIHGVKLNLSGLPYLERFLEKAVRSYEGMTRQSASFTTRAIPEDHAINLRSYSDVDDKDVLVEEDVNVRHLYFPARPGHRDDLEERVRKQALRNILAVLYGVPLVGRSSQNMYELLTELTGRLCVYACHGADYRTSKIIETRLIPYVKKLNYIKIGDDVQHGIHMLAWCESDNVQWEYGWHKVFSSLYKVLTQDHFMWDVFNECLYADTQVMLYDAWYVQA